MRSRSGSPPWRLAHQQAQPGEQPRHQGHGHDLGHIDRLAEQEQARTQQLGELVVLAGPGAGEVVGPVAGIEVVVEEVTHHQAHVAVALKGEGGRADPGPVQALGVDVDAGLLAGHAGALLTAIGQGGAAHRLGDRTAGHVGGAAEQTGRGGVDALHRRHRAEVLAPGLAAVEPAHGDRGGDGEQQPARQHQPIGIEEEDAAAQAHEQPAELELGVVLRQPGIGRHLGQLEAQFPCFGVLLPGLALPAEGAGDLGEEGEGADAAPALVAEHQQHKDARGHHRTPEQGGAEGIGLLHQAAALHRHARVDEPQRAPGVIRFGEAGGERIEEQRSDDQQPAGGEEPPHQMQPPLRRLGRRHLGCFPR